MILNRQNGKRVIFLFPTFFSPLLAAIGFYLLVLTCCSWGVMDDLVLERHLGVKSESEALRGYARYARSCVVQVMRISAWFLRGPGNARWFCVVVLRFMRDSCDSSARFIWFL